MKFLFIIFCLILSPSMTLAWGNKDVVNRVLYEHGQSRRSLKKKGLRVVDGEFTGVGRKVKLGSVKYFVSGDDLLKKSRVKLVYKGGRKRGHLSDVQAIFFQGEKISSKQIIAVIISEKRP